MAKRIGIYRITSPSSKVYIGQSWDIDRRWYMYSLGHCSAQRHLFNSLKKHGHASHLFVIVEQFSETVEQGVMILTAQQAGEIRLKFKPYVYMAKQLAVEYGVSVHTIKRLLGGRSWRNHEWEAVA